jgi:hypothetical protein
VRLIFVFPGARFVDGFLGGGGVGVEGVFGWVDEGDGVLELWGWC